MKKQALSLTSDHIKTKITAASAADSVQRDIEAEPPQERIVDLNFKVKLSFRRRFKDRANKHDLTNIELLHEALAAWEREKGIKAEQI